MLPLKVIKYTTELIKIIKSKLTLFVFRNINPCSPEGFSQTYFPKGGGCCNPPLDYQYWRSYNPKFTTSV